MPADFAERPLTPALSPDGGEGEVLSSIGEITSIGLVQKCGGNGTVLPFHCTTRVRTSVIFISGGFLRAIGRSSQVPMIGLDSGPLSPARNEWGESWREGQPTKN